MSFKEVRDLAEDLKLLGYPHALPLISLAVNNGCLASFQLVAEILQWLAALLEPGTVLDGGMSTREERVLLIRSAIEYFMLKWNLKLNPRKLYAASSVSAGELLKITRLIITPATWEELPAENEEDWGAEATTLQQVDLGDRIDDLRKAREISSDLTKRGAILNELLLKEVQNKETRLNQGNRSIELAMVEGCLKNALTVNQLKVQTCRSQLETARLELNALNSKLQRKRAELERNKQRLEALQKIRPAHMQEFEQHEQELKTLFQEYFQRVHVRDALREQLEARKRRNNPMVTPVRQKVNNDHHSLSLIPEGLLIDDEEDDEEEDEEEDEDNVVRARVREDEEEIDASLMMEMDNLSIRDEDYMTRNPNLNAKMSLNRRPGTATASARLRPTTADRNRLRATATIRRHVPSESLNRNQKDDNSSLGSSDSNLDMSEFLGQHLETSASSGQGKRALQSMSDLMMLDVRNEDNNRNREEENDDDDLNSMESISISKITADFTLHPKALLAKSKPQSDEDF